MFKKLGLILLAATFCFTFAQTVYHTEVSGDDDWDAGVGSAAVEQFVNLKLPPTVALHLDVTELTFDIGLLNQEGAERNFVCVYGLDFRDDDLNPGYSPIDGQEQLWPLGTYYDLPLNWDDEQDPVITIENAGYEVTSYPPILIGEDGELIQGSKNHFVCYQTFILQKFSNLEHWNLSVSRDGGTYDMYIQDNSFCSFNNYVDGDGGITGFYALPDGTEGLSLLPDAYTDLTTGAYAAECEQGGTSWLEDLIVLAVKVDGEVAGDNFATLTYTISAEVPDDL